MHYEDIYADDEFDEKFAEALVEEAAQLPKFFSVSASRPTFFQDMSERVTRFSFPGFIAEDGGQPNEGFVFGEIEIGVDSDGYSIKIPELNFQESQVTSG